jgi:hypothetical protein
MPVGKNNVRANRYLSRDGLSPTALPAPGTTPRELQMLQQSSATATAAAAAAAAGGCATAHVSLASGGRKNKAPLPLDLARLPGEAVQVDPIKPTMKAPGIKLLN